MSLYLESDGSHCQKLLSLVTASLLWLESAPARPLCSAVIGRSAVLGGSAVLGCARLFVGCSRLCAQLCSAGRPCSAVIGCGWLWLAVLGCSRLCSAVVDCGRL